jgi:hypothetical protein
MDSGKNETMSRHRAHFRHPIWLIFGPGGKKFLISFDCQKTSLGKWSLRQTWKTDSPAGEAGEKEMRPLVQAAIPPLGL